MTDRAYWRQLVEQNPELIRHLQPRMTPYIPHMPTPKQAAFLLLNCREALFGGAAGGGKSDALLMGGLQYVDIPGYNAIILRRSYSDLALPGALMSRAEEWLSGTDARWNVKEKTWTFPSGATLVFGYLKSEGDKYRYQSSEFQYIAFDEATQFTNSQYTFMFSRRRRLAGVNIPVRTRAASNPGGPHGEWVKQRFIVEGRKFGRIFIPSRLEDNPYIDRVEYEASLAELDPVTRRQLLEGDWDASYDGGLFKRDWFRIVDQSPRHVRRVRYWDMASTEPTAANPDPDWTVGALVARDDSGNWYICHIERFRLSPQQAAQRIRQTAELDGQSTYIRMEEEPGSSGKMAIDYYHRHVLADFPFKGVRSSGDKQTRAAPLSSQAEAGNVYLVRGDWISDFLNEASVFPYGAHDDQVDAVSGAYGELAASASQSVAKVQFKGLWERRR